MGVKSKSLKRPRAEAETEVQEQTEEVEVPTTRRSDEEPPVKQSRWTNKTRVLVLAARNINYRGRHLMTDIKTMMPHGKADSKMHRCLLVSPN